MEKKKKESEWFSQQANLSWHKGNFICALVRRFTNWIKFFIIIQVTFNEWNDQLIEWNELKAQVNLVEHRIHVMC